MGKTTFEKWGKNMNSQFIEKETHMIIKTT